MMTVYTYIRIILASEMDYLVPPPPKPVRRSTGLVERCPPPPPQEPEEEDEEEAQTKLQRVWENRSRCQARQEEAWDHEQKILNFLREVLVRPGPDWILPSFLQGWYRMTITSDRFSNIYFMSTATINPLQLNFAFDLHDLFANIFRLLFLPGKVADAQKILSSAFHLSSKFLALK